MQKKMIVYGGLKWAEGDSSSCVSQQNEAMLVI